MNASPAANNTAMDNNRESFPLLLLLIVLNIGLLLIALHYMMFFLIDADEVEHAHVTWVMTQGVIPYRDLHQIHTPLLWLVFAPVMWLLPQSVTALIVLRSFCLLAFGGMYVAGLCILRDIQGAVSRTQALIMLLICLSVVPQFQFFRFRPDPFMALCVAWAIWAALRIRIAPRKYAFLCGLGLGVAAAFSPKMAPLCLLAPILGLWECRRRRTLQPLWLIVPNAAGFLVGVLPVALWLAFYGLLPSFWNGVVTTNSHMLNLLEIKTLRAIEAHAVLIALAFFGGLLFISAQRRAMAETWSPEGGLIVAAILSWLVLIIEPNHLLYNWQIFTMSAGVLGTLLIGRMLAWDGWSRTIALTGVSVALLLVSVKTVMEFMLPPLKSGWSISMDDLQELIDLRPSSEATCVGFAPWHPIFCRDATELYLEWDLAIIGMPWITPTGRQMYADMWPRAVVEIERTTPAMITCWNNWDLAARNGILPDALYQRFLEVLKTRYERVMLKGPDGNVVYVRRPTPPTEKSPPRTP